MAKKTRSVQRREDSLSREQIVNASIELLDSAGEDGLTFRALSNRLATGPGAIYWHIADKNDLLNAACDAVIARTLEACSEAATPKKTVRVIALRMFDAMDAHPWVGSALIRAQLQSPMVRVVERLGQQVRALGVPQKEQWAAVSALFSYILGVGGHNAANGQLARIHGLDREEYLESVSTVWSQLDAKTYPFVRSVAGLLRTHDDRADFLAGIDLILVGLSKNTAAKAAKRGARTSAKRL